MKSLELKRIACDGIQPTMGVLLSNGRPFAVTLERPWLHNRKGESCIPEGTYQCLRCSNSPDYGHQDSPKFGDTFQVMEVPNRSHILFHKGNINDDSHGCILIGEQYGLLSGHDAVLSSSVGFGEFLAILQHDDEFTLRITNHYSQEQ